ncbi:MAG: M23 family metallopeptidase [Actinobacteria bacterium]|nr:M23 family metallopeptidase [Actinomycetota bacterium]
MVVAGVAPNPAAIARTTSAAIDARQAAATQAAHVTNVGHPEHRVRLNVRSELSRVGSSASSRGRLPIRTFVTRGFDPPARRWLAGHRGVDLAAFPAAVVHAPAAGVIRFVGSIAGIGIVSVMHLNGVVSTYQPVQPLVPVGTPVLAGQPIAVVTVSGHCGLQVCLHWGAKRGFAYVNPLVAFHAAPRLMTP